MLKTPFGLQPCSSSPINLRYGSADKVVLPVPDSPKNKATSPSLPTFAEQCMDKIFFRGNKRFIMEKTDFLISPAYSVPPIRTIFCLKDTSTNASEFVPSFSGLALNDGADIIVNSGSCVFSSSADGRTNNCFANKLCQAYSLITCIGKR